MKNASSLIWALFLLCFPIIAYGQAGFLKGHVDDEATKQALIGATVLVRGTFLGSATDTVGNFLVKEIPPGRYTVDVSMVGYGSSSFPEVLIVPGRSATLEVHMVARAIESDQVIVTASRREQSSHDVPVSISTVSARTLAMRLPTTLDDALRYIPGVNLAYDQVNIRGSSGYSRGVGTRVLLLFDGLPYLTGDTGEITWETIPMFQIGRIEVVKGAGSALYGSSALGGVVNIVTKEIPENPEMSFRLYSGVYSNPGFPEWNWSLHSRLNSGGFVSFSDRVGSFRYLLSFSRSVDESYRENDTYHRWNFYVKTKYDFSAVQSLSVMANFMHRTHGNFFWWNGLDEATRPADAQRNGNVEWNRGNASFSYKEFVSDKMFYTVKGTYYGNFWRDDSSGRVNNVSASHFFYTEVQATFGVTTGNILTCGLAASYDAVTSNLFGNHQGRAAAVFVQDEFSINNQLKLTGGARFDWQGVVGIAGASQLNPKLGVVYALDGQMNLRASLGTGFRYPATSELYTSVTTGISPLKVVPNPGLQAERSTSYEIGISHSLAGQVVLDGSLFMSDFSELIEGGVDTTLHPAVIRFSNLTRARILGFEVGVKASIVERLLQGSVGYTYVDAKDLSTGAVLKFRPRHTLYTSLESSLNHLSVVVDFRYISQLESIDENLASLIKDGDQRVPIKVTDVRAFCDLTDASLPLRVGIGVTNVFNYHYVELIGNLAPVRLVTFSIDGVF